MEGTNLYKVKNIYLATSLKSELLSNSSNMAWTFNFVKLPLQNWTV